MRNSEKKRRNVLSSILQYLPEVVRAYHETKAKVFNLFFSGWELGDYDNKQLQQRKPI